MSRINISNDIYIICAEEDRNVAEKLNTALSYFGVEVKGRKEFGLIKTMISQEKKAIENSDLVAVLWSKKSVNSAMLRQQALNARRHEVLISILIENLTPPYEITKGIRDINLINWDGAPDNQGILDIVNELKEVEKTLLSTRHEQTENNKKTKQISQTSSSNSLVAIVVPLAVASIAATATIIGNPSAICFLGLKSCPTITPTPPEPKQCDRNFQFTQNYPKPYAGVNDVGKWFYTWSVTMSEPEDTLSQIKSIQYQLEDLALHNRDKPNDKFLISSTTYNGFPIGITVFCYDNSTRYQTYDLTIP